MDARLKDLIDEIRQNYEYNDRYRQLLSEITEALLYKKVLEPHSTEIWNIINPSELGQEEIAYVKDALADIINTAQSEELAGSAIEMLGRFGDVKYVPMLRQKLELYLKKFLRANHPFTACIHALDNCGEEIKEGSSFGIDKVEKNIEMSRNYLEKFNKNVPW